MAAAETWFHPETKTDSSNNKRKLKEIVIAEHGTTEAFKPESHPFQKIRDEGCECYTQSNGPRLYQLRRDISLCVQGSLSITMYFEKLKAFWDELSSLVILPPYSCGSSKALQQYQQPEHLIQFLMGLRDSYSAIRGKILLMEPLPTVNCAYALLLQEEKQQPVAALSGTINDSSALAVSASSNKKFHSGPREGDAQNSPSSDEEPDFDDDIRHKTIRIPNDKVGLFIGEGGCTINCIKLYSGAEIQLAKDSEAGSSSPKRAVTLSGTPEDISKAEILVKHVVSEVVAEKTDFDHQLEYQVPKKEVTSLIVKFSIWRWKTNANPWLLIIPPPLEPAGTTTTTVHFGSIKEKDLKSLKDLVFRVIYWDELLQFSTRHVIRRKLDQMEEQSMGK